MDGGATDLDKSERGMKRVRLRIRRLPVDLADDALVAGFHGLLEQIVVKPARIAAPACGRSDHNAVHVSEARRSCGGAASGSVGYAVKALLRSSLV